VPPRGSLRPPTCADRLRELALERVGIAGQALAHRRQRVDGEEPFDQRPRNETRPEIVELSGDLKGFVLYHVTSVFDFAAGTLVNTGDQVFSGTVAGSAPVMIHDDRFSFQVNLFTGEESGRVHLFDHVAGDKVRGELDVVGTGLTAEGNPTFNYRGECISRGQQAAGGGDRSMLRALCPSFSPSSSPPTPPSPE
jgi:hypothetical protein